MPLSPVPGPYAALAAQAVEHTQVTKLATDAGLTVAQVRSLAALVRLTPAALVKAAYADPADFAQFLGQATGRIKQAGVLGSLTGLLAKLRAAPGAVGGAINSRMAGTRVDNVLGAALSRAPAVANATPTRRLLTGGTLLGGAEELGRRTVTGGTAPATPPIGPVPGAGPALAGMQAPKPAAPAAAGPMGPPKPKPLVGPPKPPKTAPGGSAQGPAAAGLSPAMRGLLVGGGTLAAGAAGGALLAGRSARKKDKKEKSAELHAIGRLIEKQAAAGRRLQRRAAFCRYLDKVAADLPLTRQAVLRTIQGELARGRSLGYAVKQAYPHASGEDRGLFMGQLVRLAAKQAESAGGIDSTSVATATPSTYTGPAGGGAEAMKSLTGF